MDLLLNVILDEEKFVVLKESMAKDLCTENALFMSDLLKFHREVNRPFFLAKQDRIETTVINTDEAKFVKILFERYIRVGAVNELNISSGVRQAIVTRIKEASGPESLQLSLLDPVKEEIARLICMNNLWKINFD